MFKFTNISDKNEEFNVHDHLLDSYDLLIGGVDASFINISQKAQDYILDKPNSAEEKSQGISIIADAKMDRKASYSIQFI
mgnify:CR=1 FL=1